MQRITNTANRLKQYMDEESIKQIDIIERCKPFFTDELKLSKSKLSQYVSGTYQPKSDMLYLLGQGLGVSELWLMGYNVSRDGTETTEEFRQRMHDQNGTIFDLLEKATPEQRTTIEKIIKTIVSDE